MATLVSIDTETGGLKRYECGGERIRLTHIASPVDGPKVLSKHLIEEFRRSPPTEFAVEPTPPRGPTGGAARPALFAVNG